jgi:hypothetical protein
MNNKRFAIIAVLVGFFVWFAADFVIEWLNERANKEGVKMIQDAETRE